MRPRGGCVVQLPNSLNRSISGETGPNATAVKRPELITSSPVACKSFGVTFSKELIISLRRNVTAEIILALGQAIHPRACGFHRENQVSLDLALGGNNVFFRHAFGEFQRFFTHDLHQLFQALRVAARCKFLKFPYLRKRRRKSPLNRPTLAFLEPPERAWSSFPRPGYRTKDICGVPAFINAQGPAAARQTCTCSRSRSTTFADESVLGSVVLA